MTDVQAIRALLTDRENAVAEGDAAGAVAAFAPSATSYDLQPPLAIRFDARSAAAELESWFATWEGAVETRLADPAITVEGELAVAFGLSCLTGTPKGGAPLSSWFRSTMVLRKEADAWRIVHEHNSFPMLMDGSGLAATDLQPE